MMRTAGFTARYYIILCGRAAIDAFCGYRRQLPWLPAQSRTSAVRTGKDNTVQVSSRLSSASCPESSVNRNALRVVCNS